jgi:ankyrin repeat protein
MNISLTDLAVGDACRDGNAERLRQLLREVERHPVGAYMGTCLRIAAEKGFADLVSILLEYFITQNKSRCINSVDRYGITALHLACSNGHHEVVDVLMRHGVKVNYPQSSNSPLHAACSAGHVYVVKTLLDHNADVNVGSITPLYNAYSEEHLEVVKLLVANGAVCKKDLMSDMHLYSYLGQADKIIECAMCDKESVNCKDLSGKTPLHVACMHGHVHAVRQLLKLGASVEMRDKGGWTALHHAADRGYVEVIKPLLKHGAHVDCKDNYKDTPLHRACQKTHAETVKLLLEAGASIHTKDWFGRTTIHDALHPEIVHILCAYGANPNTNDNAGQLPLHRVCFTGDVEVATALIENGGLVDAKESGSQCTPLHLAIKNRHVALVTRLLEKGADPNISIGDLGTSCLHYACGLGLTDIVLTLLKNGAIPDEMTGDQTRFNSPLIAILQCASILKKRPHVVFPIVDALIDAGCRLDGLKDTDILLEKYEMFNTICQYLVMMACGVDHYVGKLLYSYAWQQKDYELLNIIATCNDSTLPLVLPANEESAGLVEQPIPLKDISRTVIRSTIWRNSVNTPITAPGSSGMRTSRPRKSFFSRIKSIMRQKKRPSVRLTDTDRIKRAIPFPLIKTLPLPDSIIMYLGFRDFEKYALLELSGSCG